LKLGRNPDKTDITITDGTVSRIHAEIQSTKDGRFVIKDLNSGIYNQLLSEWYLHRRCSNPGWTRGSSASRQKV
jgi:hypothetical protein